MYSMAELFRKKMLGWFEHEQMRDEGDTTITILQVSVDGNRNRADKTHPIWRALMKEIRHKTR